MSTQREEKGDGWVLDGTKTWISNGGIADFYVVFAKAEEGISAFVVDAKEVDASRAHRHRRAAPDGDAAS